jgi:hypothetical protein
MHAALSRREGIAVTIVTREHSAVGSNGQVRAALCGATWTGETKAQRRIRDAFRRREQLDEQLGLFDPLVMKCQVDCHGPARGGQAAAFLAMTDL